MESEIKTDSKGRKTVLNTCTEPCAIERGMRLLVESGRALLFHLKDDLLDLTTCVECLAAPAGRWLISALKSWKTTVW